jgi:hypothetical protein
LNENKLYKDDIQRFIESQLPWKHHKKTPLRYKCLKPVLWNYKRSKKVRRNTCKCFKYYLKHE